MSGKPSIVFCHGLWADGSCFSKLIPTLRAEGYECITAEYGLDSLQGDVDCTIRALGRVSSPAFLVGHSQGGTVITAAGIDDRVIGLVYLCALAPDETETAQSLQDKFPATDVFSHIEVADNRVWLLRSGIDYFCGDLTPDEKEIVWATSMSPGGRPVHPEGGRHRLEDEAERVHRRHARPHGQPGAGAGRVQANGRHDLRDRQRPRSDDVAPRGGAHRDPRPRQLLPGKPGDRVARSGPPLQRSRD